MSLNRTEQMVFDYLQAQREERQFWQSKVQNLHGRLARDRAARARGATAEMDAAESAGSGSATQSPPAFSAAPDVAAELERSLWEYFVERSGVTEPFRSEVARHGLTRISLRNLADLLLRLWGPEEKPRAR